MRSKRQFAHDFGDLGHMREVARADLVDVLLQLLLDSSRRALRRQTNGARWSHAHASDEGHASLEGRLGSTTSAIDFSTSQVRRSGGMLQRDGSLLTSASLLRPCLA